MGDGGKALVRLRFNPKVRLEFHGATITSAAGLRYVEIQPRGAQLRKLLADLGCHLLGTSSS